MFDVCPFYKCAHVVVYGQNMSCNKRKRQQPQQKRHKDNKQLKRNVVEI